MQNVMRNWIARRMLRATRKRYGYDTSYLEMMLEHSPKAFFKFAHLMKAAGHREVVAVDAGFAANLSARWPRIAVPAPSCASTWRWKRAWQRSRLKRSCAATRAP
jgi:hypothetical protein